MVNVIARLFLVSSTDSSMRRMSRLGTRQSRRPTKRMRTPRSFISSRRRSEDRLVEAHEVADLVGGALPVLGREGVDGEPLDARARARPRRCRTGPPRPRRGPRCASARAGWAHRPLPSITQATWVGMRSGSMPGIARATPAEPDRRGTASTPSGTRTRSTVAAVLPRAGTVTTAMARSDRGRRRTLGRRVTAALPARRVDDPGQVEMAGAVGRAIADERHLIVQAGTGTGKTLAYLVPAVRQRRQGGRRHRHQGAAGPARRQGPALPAEHLDRPFDFAVLKGRSNYVCLQRLRRGYERATAAGHARAAPGDTSRRRRARRPAGLGRDDPRPATGPSSTSSRRPRAWAAVSVGAAGVPGRQPTAHGARTASPRRPDGRPPTPTSWWSTPTSTARTSSAGGAVLPEHDVVVIDEAHQLEDVVSDDVRARAERRPLHQPRPASSRRSSPTDSHRRPRRGRPAASPTPCAADVGRRLRGAWTDRPARRRTASAHGRRPNVSSRRRAASIPDDGPGDVGARKQRALKAADIADRRPRPTSPTCRPADVAWVEGPDRRTACCGSHPSTWPRCCAGAVGGQPPPCSPAPPSRPASATRLGLATGDVRRARRRQPLRLRAPRAALLRRPPARPAHARLRGGDARRARGADRRRRRAHARPLHQLPGHERRGRARCGARCPGRVLTQNDLPKPALVGRSPTDETDVPVRHDGLLAGHRRARRRRCSLVTIDRLPFPRPDEPLLQARRERARADALPHRSTCPARPRCWPRAPAGSSAPPTDRGVVAVLDPRLANSASYRWDIVNALPPMRRTREHAEADDFLTRLHDHAH